MSRRSRPWRLAPLFQRLSRDQWLSRNLRRTVRGYEAWQQLGDEGRRIIGANHRQPRRATPAARPPAIVLPRTQSVQRPSQRPAARPSWAISAGCGRRGMGYGKEVRGAATRP